MKNKYLTLAFTFILVISLTGCGQEELPSDISTVGDNIEQKQDLLDQTEIVNGEGGVETTPSQNFNNINIDDLEALSATVQDIQGWLSDYVSGKYSSKEDGSYVHNSATLNAGGVLDIITYYDNYYMTEFRFTQKEDVYAALSKYVPAYIGRALTDEEAKEIQGALSALENGSTLEFIPSLANTAAVYIMLDGEAVIVQVR